MPWFHLLISLQTPALSQPSANGLQISTYQEAMAHPEEAPTSDYGQRPLHPRIRETCVCVSPAWVEEEEEVIARARSFKELSAIAYMRRESA